MICQKGKNDKKNIYIYRRKKGGGRDKRKKNINRKKSRLKKKPGNCQ